MTDWAVKASFFYAMSKDSCKSLATKGLRGAGPRKSLIVNDLGVSHSQADADEYGENEYFNHICLLSVYSREQVGICWQVPFPAMRFPFAVFVFVIE